MISPFFLSSNDLFVKLTNVFFLEEEILLENLIIFVLPRAGVVKLVDTLDLGSSASRHGGSSPFTRTIKKPSLCSWLFLFYGSRNSHCIFYVSWSPFLGDGKGNLVGAEKNFKLYFYSLDVHH